ncbi:DapH/DapD/GlmU-related protein [Vibrio tasmaniensis]|uniref:DapH/DapD/GlmU-related protein n=1 Tax=Vibrio tasmaniensis TaxID=212663 RepID=UPI00111A0EE3|nr:DapH/DapD/GlmU-related protein [Vibrio tasmaniensis]
MNVISSYSFSSIIRLAFNFIRTKIFYPNFRLLRSPYYFRGKKYMSIGKGFTSGVGLRIDCLSLTGKSPNLIIGSNCQVNDYVHIGCVNSVIIGDNVLIASKVFITDHNHGVSDFSDIESPPIQRSLSFGEVRIGDSVWLGENVTILPNVKIGKNCIIGASAVVTKSIPDYSIAVGNPAKVIKKYNIETQKWVLL